MNMNSSGKRSSFRWVIVALLFYSTTIVYFDRVILGILAPYITAEVGWSEQEYGYVVFAFQLTYAIGPLFIGYVIDRLGTRWGLSLAVVVWGIASLSHAAARSWLGFALARWGWVSDSQLTSLRVSRRSRNGSLRRKGLMLPVYLTAVPMPARLLHLC